VKIAVTGSAGTIGTRLCADLARDHDVVGIDLHDADIVADVRDLGALEGALRGCDAVVHLAGFAEVETPWEDVYAVNIAGTYNAYEAARRAGVKRVIFASSNHAVGMHEVENVPAIYEPGFGLVVGTDSEYRPDSLYGVAKAFGETLGRFYSDNHGLLVTCVRIGSMTRADNPRDPSVAGSSGWLPLSEEQRFRRYAATWMSQADFARLVRLVLDRDVAFSIVYGVGDNATRFWDLEAGRATFGFWPQDGSPPKS
jgi:nucleoside-diphosphate-sugar epimerase